MAAAKTTTIRVSTTTRDRLKALAARRGESASELVAELVAATPAEAWSPSRADLKSGV